MAAAATEHCELTYFLGGNTNTDCFKNREQNLAPLETFI
jgi:hypothetical protein